MTRRITKAMAEEASDMMKKKAYGRKIDNVQVKINAAIEELTKKYIPAPVIACVAEFTKYFDVVGSCNITTFIERPGYTYTCKESYINGKLTFKIPSFSRYITVDNKEYEAVRKLVEKRNKLKKEQDQFGQQMTDALIALRTDKAVEKELPEAMKYLHFPEVKAVPMPVFTGLREIIGSIKDED